MKKLLLSALTLCSTIAFGQNLTLHYTMDNVTASAGPTGDLIPNGTGTAANLDSLGATMTTGEYCGSFLNGAGYRSTVALSNVGWAGIALSYWYKSQSNFQGVIFQGAYLGFGSRILSNGSIEGTFDGSAAGSHTSNTSVNDGIWHHIVIQNGGSTTQIYIDGVLDNFGPETLYTMPSANSQALIYMGSHINDVANEKIYGKVDEVKVFDNILDQTQIDNLFAYGACLVNIPDANFKAYLVGNTSINTNADTEIQCSEAAAFTGQIWVQALGISDLTGIEAFTSLTSLNCNSNSLTSIDVSNNTALVILNIAGNSISSIDVSANTNLYDLFCDYNDITSLDVSANLGLGKLNISNNLLTTLDLSSNNQLIELGCESNELTVLNVKNTNNTNVTAFYVTGNADLTCIEVDDVAYSTTNWTNIDPGASFSLDCSSTASINENTSIELSIFPNPASDVITVNTSAQIEEVNVFDTYGNLVNTFNASTFSVSHLSAGIYFLTVSTEQGTVQSKFIKE